MYINPLFLCLIFLSFCAGIGKEVCVVYGVAFLHECGHMLAAKYTGTKIKSVRFMPWGVCMDTEPFKSKKAEWITAAMGPVVNLGMLSVQFIWQNEIFMLSNLFMLLINLLPVLPLDGGRIFKAFLTEELGEDGASFVMRLMSLILTIVLFFAGVFLFYKTGINFSVLLIAIFIACATSELNVFSFGVHRDVESVKHYAVLEYVYVGDVLKFSSAKKVVLFDVLDCNRKYLGTVTMREVMEEIANKGYEINFAEILQKQLQNEQFCSTIDNV